jgi:hypothetical protein
MRCCFLFLVALCISTQSLAQSSTVLSNNPPLRWQQINTPHFKIIYPTGFEEMANRMANTMEHIRTPEAASLGSLPKKISIVLQNQSSVSNAFVSITPRRSEFYTMPSQNYNFLGNNDWMNLIASHEYRHIVQFQHANRGFNKALYYLFGNNTLSVMSYISVPAWFWEGDAVATETAFTPGGRGRIPYFDLLFKTNMLEGRTFNYHKQFLRSYKHNIPDHYVLGYNLVSYLREKTNNPNIWEQITARAWHAPFVPFTFSNALKKESGLYVKELYTEMAADFQKKWKEQIDTLTLTPFEKVNPRTSNAYTDYFYPHELNDHSVLVMKSGIGHIEELITIRNGEERKLFTPGPINNTGMISVANNRVVWNEYRFDPRWRVRTYSVIMGYDFGSNTKQVISKSSRYAAAALSPDGTQVATIETTTDYKTRLVILDYASGAIVKQFANPDNSFISMPRWERAGKFIYALNTNSTGKAIVRFDYSSGSMTALTEYTQENVGYPVPLDEYVLYNSPRSGIDNIYALHMETGKRYQLTTSKYGAYNPSVHKDEQFIYYNEQSRDGMDVAQIPFAPEQWKEVSREFSQPGTFYQHLVEQENNPELFNQVPTEKFPTTNYSRVGHMLNPYSWGMYFNDDLTKADIGISSQDVLSTTRLNAGYTFDINERTGAWNAGLSYQGFYPIIDVNFLKGSRSVNEGDLRYEKVVGTDTTTVVENLTFDWKESTVEAGLRIPLITTRSRFSGSLTISNYVGYTRVSEFTNSIDGGGRIIPSNYPQYFFRNYADGGNLVYNHFSLSGYRLLKQSRRDINSKWGQLFFMDLYGTPYEGDYSGKQFSFQGRLYFPGLFRHHSFWGYWAYQNADIADVNITSQAGLNNYTFRNQIPLPRGQSVSRFENFYSMSANYTLPLWYPDVSLGPLVNIQRIRANAFFDYGFGNSLVNERKSSMEYISTGVEVKLDINVLRLLPQLDIGFRYSYGLSPSVSKFEFLLGTLNF